MTQSVIEAICSTLKKEFRDSKIYIENIKQGFDTPCFFISCVNTGTKLVLDNRYLKTTQYNIQYFPQSENRANEECRITAEEMILLLEYIKLNDNLIRGT